MKTIQTGLIITMLCIFATGCASSRSGKVYTRDQARQVHTVQFGIIDSIQQVKIEGTKSGTGTAVGGISGGVIGSTVGSGSGRTIATVVGAIAGGLAGSAIEEKSTAKDALEITVTLDRGKTLTIVQEADDQFDVGERVRVLTGPQGEIRVRHM